MATVVLLGCSTSGKSSAVRRFQSMYGNGYGNQSEVIDTDALVAADSEFNGHLYAMYLKFTRRSDNSAAQLYLELGERHLLKQLANKKEPVLIAAGPNIPLREPEWSNFLRVVNPICFYFRLTPKQLYEGLRRRRIRQGRRGLDLCPGFGCWDAGLATAFNQQSSNWEEIPSEQALPLIEQYLAKVDPIYASACHPEFIYEGESVKNDQAVQEELSRKFVSCLRWAPIVSPMAAAVSVR